MTGPSPLPSPCVQGEGVKSLSGSDSSRSFRSCRSVAELLNYQLRLFRPDEVQLVGGSGPEDLDLGAFSSGDAVVVIGFAPYSTASVLSARAAHESGATLIAITDTMTAPAFFRLGSFGCSISR